MGLLDNLLHTCKTLQRVRTAGPSGGHSSSFVTKEEGVSCWMQAASDTDIERFEKRGMSVTHKFYFGSDPGLDERHAITEVKFKDGTSLDSRIFEVRSASERTAGFGVGYRVFAERTTVGDTTGTLAAASLDSSGETTTETGEAGGTAGSTSVTVRDPLTMDVTRPWSGWPRLWNDGSNATENKNNLTTLLSSFPYRLGFREGIYDIDGKVTAGTNQAVPSMIGAGPLREYSSNSNSNVSAGAVIRWKGPTGGIMLEFRNSGIEAKNILLYGKPSSDAGSGQRAGLGVFMGRTTGTEPANPAKASCQGFSLEECDVAAQFGKTTPAQGGDDTYWKDMRITNCRIGVQLANGQNVNHRFKNVQMKNTEEVMFNVLGGGILTVENCRALDSSGRTIIVLRLSNSGIGSDSGTYIFNGFTADGGSGPMVLLDDNETGGLHRVTFRDTLLQGDKNCHARINGPGQLDLRSVDEVQALTGRIFASGSSATNRAKVRAYDTNGKDGIDTLMNAGSGHYWKMSRGMCTAADMTADEGPTLVATAPTAGAITAWAALVDAIYDSSTDAFGSGGGANL